jgi:hypothetical protein
MILKICYFLILINWLKGATTQRFKSIIGLKD